MSLSTTIIDPVVVRGDFPIFRSHPDLVYLDSAATTHKPEVVIRAENDFYASFNANVHRGIYRLAEDATALYEEARRRLADFIGAETDETVFTSGATMGLNLVAFGWGLKFLKSGDEILLTESEHHANLVPWQRIAGMTGSRLRFLPFDEHGRLPAGDLDRYWSDRVRIVAMPMVSNVLGLENPVREIADIAHARGAIMVVDAAQAVPHTRVDVNELNCDFLAFSGHKMFGPMGTGVLYGRRELLEAMDPFMTGGEMISTVTLERAEWNVPPYKFEAGTPNAAGAAGLCAAAGYLGRFGMESVRETVAVLTRYAVSRLRRTENITLYGSPEESLGIIAFNLEGVHGHDAAQFLDSRGIAVRAGRHCAHPLMDRLGIPASLRASLHIYNSRRDIDAFIDALAEAAEFFAP